MNNHFAVFASSLALAGLAVQADAAIVFDSLSGPTSFFGPAPGLGASFSTGAGGGVLSDVKLLLTGSSDFNGSPTLDLYSDSVGGPGAFLTTIATSPAIDSGLSPTPAVVDFPLSSPFGLQPNSRYWVVISGATNAKWGFTPDLSGVGVSQEGMFLPNPPYNSFWGDLPNQAVFYALQMQVTVAPEPSTMLAGVSGVLVAGAALLRKRRGERG